MDETLHAVAGYYQMGYVTRDIDRAMALFGETHGLASFAMRRDACYETRDGREAHCHLAFAYAGAIEIELIEPISGHVDIYASALPTGSALVAFHHVSRLCGDVAELEAAAVRFAQMGVTLPVNGRSAGGRYFYADFRGALGHFVEHLAPSEMLLRWMREIPRY